MDDLEYLMSIQPQFLPKNESELQRWKSLAKSLIESETDGKDLTDKQAYHILQQISNRMNEYNFTIEGVEKNVK